MDITNLATSRGDYCRLPRDSLFASSTDLEPVQSFSLRRITPYYGIYQWEISLHSAGESLSILFRSDDGGLAFACTTEKCGFLDPTLEFFVPSVCAHIIWQTNKLTQMCRRKGITWTYQRCRQRAHSSRYPHLRLTSNPWHLCPPGICCHYIALHEECVWSVREDRRVQGEQLIRWFNGCV